MTIVPHDQLDPQTLQALLEDYVTRDGAVHGHQETSIEEKSADLLAQLKRGMVVIVFDAESQTWTIVTKDQARG